MHLGVDKRILAPLTSEKSEFMSFVKNSIYYFNKNEKAEKIAGATFFHFFSARHMGLHKIFSSVKV